MRQTLTAEEMDAVEAMLHDYAHEAVDVEDAPPSIAEDEDTFWAYTKYHALRKLYKEYNES